MPYLSFVYVILMCCSIFVNTDCVSMVLVLVIWQQSYHDGRKDYIYMHFYIYALL